MVLTDYVKCELWTLSSLSLVWDEDEVYDDFLEELIKMVNVYEWLSS